MYMYCILMSSCIPWISKWYGSSGSDVSVKSVESAETPYIRGSLSIENGKGSGKP